MARFLIEVPHEDNQVACARAIQVFHEVGSHFLANADWGCLDGVHKAWIILEGDRKEDAISVLPLEVRPKATVVELTKFTMDDADALLSRHHGQQFEG
jgi:hypothetical protein